MSKTNILNYYIAAFGEDTIIEAINKAKVEFESRHPKTETKISPVTNPIIRFLMNTIKINGDKLSQDFTVKIFDENQYVYFNVAGGALKYVFKEIKNNKKYLNELKRGLLGFDIGPALSDLNELISGAFYKHLGYQIEFSDGEGKPDINILDTQYATDAKLFPNGQIQLLASLNESRTLIPEVFSGIGAGNLIVHIRNPDKKSLHKSFVKLKEYFESNSDEFFKDENIGILGIPNEYEAGDLTISFSPQGLNVYFQATWPMDESIKSLKQKIRLSVVQAQKLNKQAITWVFMPDDAKKHAVQSSVLRYAAGLHNFVEGEENLTKLIIYSLVPSKNGNKIGADISTDVYGGNLTDMLITKENVHTFLENLLKTPEIIVP